MTNKLFPITPLTIFFALFCGATAAYLAHTRGENPYKWFFIGLLFGIFGLFAVFFLPTSQNKVAPTMPLEEPRLPKISGPVDKFWYYLNPNHEQQGPISYQALNTALHQGKISLSTYVWNEDMTQWKLLQEITKL